MKLRKLNTADYFLIIANIIPVYGVWFEGWNAAHIFLVFCMETVIIGIFNVVKMGCVSAFGQPENIWSPNGGHSIFSSLFLIIFFIVHYGFFVFVQTQIFFSVSGLFGDSSFFSSYSKIWDVLGADGQLVLFIFIAYYTLYNLYNFFFAGAYKSISLSKLMFQPYGRILIQQFVVIVGSMFLTFGATKIFILILVSIKVFFELFIDFDSYIDKQEAEAKLNREKSEASI